MLVILIAFVSSQDPCTSGKYNYYNWAKKFALIAFSDNDDSGEPALTCILTRYFTAPIHV